MAGGPQDHHYGAGDNRRQQGNRQYRLVVAREATPLFKTRLEALA
ncbi:hypothetical protein [Aeromonas simiae]|nr:hypothetical protein [Aeromonas simiae]